MNKHSSGLLAVAGGNVIFGFSFLFSRLALNITIPSVLMAFRFAAAFLIMNIIVIVGSRLRRPDGKAFVEFSLKGKPLKNVLLLALFQPVLYFTCESYGIYYTSSAFAGVIVTTLAAEGMKSSLIGIIFLCGAVCFGAMFYVFSKKSAEHYNAIERTYVMFAMGSAVFIVFALLQCKGSLSEMILEPLTDSVFIASVIYLALASSVAAFILQNWGSNYVTVSEATLFANLTTVISIIAGVIFLRELFTLHQIIGAVAILVSVYASQKPERSYRNTKGQINGYKKRNSQKNTEDEKEP